MASAPATFPSAAPSRAASPPSDPRSSPPGHHTASLGAENSPRLARLHDGAIREHRLQLLADRCAGTALMSAFPLAPCRHAPAPRWRRPPASAALRSAYCMRYGAHPQGARLGAGGNRRASWRGFFVVFKRLHALHHLLCALTIDLLSVSA
jgi:hypothetical protein